MLDSGLAGKTCLITGGSTGIGLGISRALAREGVHLAVASRNPDPEAMEELATALRGTGDGHQGRRKFGRGGRGDGE